MSNLTGMKVAAARDAHGRPWATVLAGEGEFVSSPDPRQLWVGAQPVQGDALDGALEEGADIGLLGIDLATRRRNRVNGRIASGGEALEVAGQQLKGGPSGHLLLAGLDHLELVGLFVYEEAIPFTRESWRGRMRALRGIAASLTADQVVMVVADAVFVAGW